MSDARLNGVNSRGFHVAVPKQVGQPYNVFFKLVKRPCKQMAQVVRKHLVRVHVRFSAQHFHLAPYIGPVQRFPAVCNEYAAGFDVDEHIEMWIEAKRSGTNGVPSARELVHDAEAIDKMLDELADALAAA